MQNNPTIAKIFKFVFCKLCKYKLILVLYIILGLLTRITILLFPYLTGIIIDNLTKMNNFQIVRINIIHITLLGFASFAISICTSFLGNMLQTIVSNDLIIYIFEKLSLINLKWYRKMDSAYLSTKVTQDCNELSKFVIDYMFNLVFQFTTFIVVLIYWIKINSSIALLFILFIPLLVVIYIFFKKKMYIYNKNVVESYSKLNAQKNQYLLRLESYRIVGTYNEHLKDLTLGISNSIEFLKKKMIWSILFTNFNSLITTIARGAIFYFSSVSIYNGKMSIGEFTIVNSLFSIVLNSLNYFLNVSEMLQCSKVSFDRLKEILDISNTPNGKMPIQNLINIKIDKVSLSSEKGIILNNLSCNFEKGKIYLITGENGKGKSTFVRVLLGLFNGDYNGEILINGIEINELDMENFRKDKVSFVDQNPFVCTKNDLHSLSYSIEKVDLNKSLIEYFSLNNLLENLSYDSLNSLSGGEVQKISIINSLQNDSELLIMDEPNSALDFQSSRKLIDLLPEYKESKIIILISHDNRFQAIADKVISI